MSYAEANDECIILFEINGAPGLWVGPLMRHEQYVNSWKIVGLWGGAQFTRMKSDLKIIYKL